MYSGRKAMASILMLAALALPGLRVAQAQQVAEAAGAGSGDTLEEIVVVAQKQNISLQKAPESITAITAATLEQANILSPIDLNGQVPGLVITQSEGYNRSVSIRGIG